MTILGTIYHSCLHIFLESAPWLLLGFGVAGLSKVVLQSERWLARALAAEGLKGAAIAAVVGAPLPLCSCSVLPAAIGLRRQGASKASTASFLVSVPETDIVSVLMTSALLGPAMAIARPVAAIATALFTGWAVGAVDPDESSGEPAPKDCCAPVAAPQRHWLRRAFAYGYMEFLDDIAGPLLIGILLAGLVGAAAGALDLQRFFGVPVAGYLIALCVGIPTYVCATASTPVAVGMLAAGMSPGAILVFLLAGPATNVASFVVLGRELGRRGLAVYLLGIALGSLAFGVAFDVAFGHDLVKDSLVAVSGHTVSGVQVICAIALGLLLVASGVRQRWLVGRLTGR